MESFGRRLKRLRIDAGLTQEQLAHACGYNGQSRIANYEATGKNARLPSLSEIPTLAHALGVTDAELVATMPPETMDTKRASIEPDAARSELADLQVAVGLMAQALAASIPPAGRDFADAIASLPAQVRERGVLAKVLKLLQAELPAARNPHKRRAQGSSGRKSP